MKINLKATENQQQRKTNKQTKTFKKDNRIQWFVNKITTSFCHPVTKQR